jgi:uncharacterized membrane protein YphA (DoxX/SURF4 family)
LEGKIKEHGYGCLPNLAGFANGMVKQFAATFLPGPLVYITGFGIAIGEAVVGTLLAVGLFFRPVLVIGTLFMLLLIFGSTTNGKDVRNSVGHVCCVGADGGPCGDRGRRTALGIH